jgi:hypothetical protein
MVDKTVKKERRYYYNFLCIKCAKHNVGFITSDSKAGLATTYEYECDYCSNTQKITLTPRYLKVMEIEITKEDWLTK